MQKQPMFFTKLIIDEKQHDKKINENCVATSLYEHLIKDSNNLILFAYVNNIVVGYLCGFVKNNGDAYIETVTELEAMYVDSDYRKSGIGNALVNEFKIWLKEKGNKFIELKVCSANINAINLYKQNGFSDFKLVMAYKMKD